MNERNVSERIRKIAAEQELYTAPSNEYVEKTAADVMEGLTRDAVAMKAYEAEMYKMAEEVEAETGDGFESIEELEGFITKRASEITDGVMGSLAAEEENTKIASEVDAYIETLSDDELEKYAYDIAFGQGMARGAALQKEASDDELTDNLYTSFIYSVADLTNEKFAAELDAGMREGEAPVAEIATAAAEQAAEKMISEVGPEAVEADPELAQNIIAISEGIGNQVAEEVSAKTAALKIDKASAMDLLRRIAESGVGKRVGTIGKGIGTGVGNVGRGVAESRFGKGVGRGAELLSGSRARAMKGQNHGTFGGFAKAEPKKVLLARIAAGLGVGGATYGGISIANRKQES